MSDQVRNHTEILDGSSRLIEAIKQCEDSNKDFINKLGKAISLNPSIFDSMKITSISDISKMLPPDSKLMNKAILDGLNSSHYSSILESANAVNISISKLVMQSKCLSTSSLIAENITRSNLWKKQFQVLDQIMPKIQGTLPIHDLLVQSQLVEASKFSIASQSILSNLSIQNLLPRTVTSDQLISDSFKTTLNEFSKSYSNFFDLLSKNSDLILNLPPDTLRYSAVDFFNQARIVESIISEPDECVSSSSIEHEIIILTSEIQQENENSLIDLLEGTNPSFIKLRNGAKEALNSDNPDKIRHFSISLRELFTHVLHTLAPDDEVKSWSSDPQYYERGKPTRRARILYICSPFNCQPFSTFFKKDIDAVLALFDLFHGGTHKIDSSFTLEQLEIMFMRVDSALLFLLKLKQKTP